MATHRSLTTSLAVQLSDGHIYIRSSESDNLTFGLYNSLTLLELFSLLDRYHNIYDFPPSIRLKSHQCLLPY